MIHLDLFSGIGGFAYAVDQVWDNVEHIFCDNDPFCRQVIKKHWPESEIYDDIRAITKPTGADILTGGFPCQPFSAPGRRAGTADDRHLWPEMLRVILLTKPEWVIAENVRGLLTIEGGMVFEQVCLDMEAAGYEIQPFIIPAVGVGAPHRRDRIWFIAHNKGKSGRPGLRQTQAEQYGFEPRNAHSTTNNSKRQGLERLPEPGDNQKERQIKAGSGQPPDWSLSWIETATELCRVDDGVSVELDGFKLSPSQHRKEQIKAYGNAIVPEVAIEIMKGLKLER